MSWFKFWIQAVSLNPHAWALATAIFETLTAIGLLLGFAQKIGYVMGAVFSLAIWSTAEGFGGPYTPGATDIGTSIIYFVVFVYLLAIQYMEGITPLSLDYVIARRWRGWLKIAGFANNPIP